MPQVFYPCQLPPPLKPGDLVKVIAPSGALKELAAFEQGLSIWRSRGYKVELGSNYSARYGYLAGKDSQRRQALAEAWFDPECKAIICARGGYGGARLLEDWSWQVGEQGSRGAGEQGGNLELLEPKWIIGFSDVTSLLWSLATVGIAGVHAPVLTSLAREPEWSIQRLFDCVEGSPLKPLQGEGWGGGKVTGFLLPANLTVATHLLKTSIQPSLEGVILALEDVTEFPYRLDRMLTQWRMLDVFKQIKGIAIGRFSRCDPPLGSKTWTTEEVLRDRLGSLNIPIVSGLPFGHDGANAALPVGQIVELDADMGLLNFLYKSNLG
ncbi:MAG: LD-carboxypeptidase [Xenococcaceae cyanobacterium MO_188.B32]|nr:LD-carboxypeptidase [Xenococcaceae cyanobacterium MO_188.B32]